MLKKVILENFQAHEHSEIEFSEGIKRVLSENQEKVSNLNEQLLELKNEMEFFKV